MKRILLFGLLMLISISGINAREIQTQSSDSQYPYSGCTVITIAKGDSVFFGGNDDFNLADSYYWVQPGDSSRYGVIWIGKPDNPQQGVNEKGLAYDANGLPRFELKTQSGQIPAPGEYHLFCMQIMHECATVEEVVEWVRNHRHLPYMHDQMHFADATGDAVIISAGEDGEMVFTRKPPGDGFLVSTNFNVANPSNSYSYPCWRYDKAQELLGLLVEKEGPVSFRDLTAIMDAVHEEKGASWTIETMVVDLTNGIVYVYYFFQYDRPVVLNVEDELSNPREPGPLSRLFPEDVQKEAARRYHAARANFRINWIIGISWPVTLLISLVLLFLKRSLFQKAFWFWITAVIFLGPVALLAGYIALKACKTISCRNACIETLGSLIPVVVSYTVAISILILSTLSGKAAWQLQVGLMFGLPIIFGLAFHMAFLFAGIRKKRGSSLLRCLPLVLVITLLGLGGMIPVAMPMINKSLDMSLLMPLSPLSLMTWWAITLLGALPGGLLISLFQRHAVVNGLRFWTVLAGEENDIAFPAWGKLWWWIPVSIIILIAGLTIGVVLLK